MRTASRKSDRRSGQVMIMVTLVLIPMFGIMGLVVDLGYMHFVKMEAQTAAEVAAKAAIIDFHATVGGAVLACGGLVVCQDPPADCAADIVAPTNSIERGCMYAQQHGFKTAGNQRVTYQAGVTGPPPTAPGIGAITYWVTYRAVQKVPQGFSFVLGNTTGMVAARSTAAVMGSNDCIYAMNPGNVTGISAGGTPQLISSCGLYVNSSSSCAISTNGSAKIQAPEYDIVGSYCASGLVIPPTPNTGVVPASDPLASLPVPASAPYHCDHTNYSVGNWSNPTLSPGVYCGGIDVKNNNYTLLPGTYILVGGGIHTQNANANIAGTGVMIYNTFGLGDGHNYSYSPIDISANSSVSLTAGTTGTCAGILFFEDRAAPASTDDYGGGASAVYEGVIYALHAEVRMHGNSSINTKYTMLVCDTISMVGTTTFNNDYSSLPNGSPIQQVSIVE